MLTIALPFAVLPLLEARRTSERLRYLLVIGLIMAADLSTGRKTAIYAPLAAFIVLAAYKRQLLRWMPIAIIVLIPVIHFASPGALGGIRQIVPSSSNGDYTDGRAGDYAAVAPDILNNVIIGRGYGTLDTSNWRTYRILDNQYLDTLFVVGVVGLIAYLAIVFTAIMTADGVIRARRRSSTAGAGGRGCLRGVWPCQRDLRCRGISAGRVFILVRRWSDRGRREQANRAAADACGRPSPEHRGGRPRAVARP